jgi:hypothetical protein
MFSWEGLSCEGKTTYGRSRGALICGTKGSVIVDRDGYEVFDLDDKQIDRFTVGKNTTSKDLLSIDGMTEVHFQNLINAIREGEKLHSPIEEGNISVTMLELANIAWKVKRSLRLESKGGMILDDAEAMRFWGREYEKGWEVTI